MRNRILSLLGWLLIKVVHGTIKIKTINKEVRNNCIKSGQRFVYAFWHGRQFLLINWVKDSVAIMTSLSRDGRLQDTILRMLGHHPVAGSSSRGALRGLVGMIKAVKKDRNSAFAVDGPRGPIHKVKPGVVYLASKTGCVIIPLTSRAKHRRIFTRSWDKYQFPRLFTSAVVILGEPITVPANADEKMIALKQEEVEKALLKYTKQADDYFDK